MNTAQRLESIRGRLKKTMRKNRITDGLEKLMQSDGTAVFVDMDFLEHAAEDVFWLLDEIDRKDQRIADLESL